MTRAEVLLHLSAAVRLAFPDRADAILEQVDGWFQRSEDPGCSICRGPLEGVYAGASIAPFGLDGAPPRSPVARAVLRPAFRMLSAGPPPAIALCGRCLYRLKTPSDIPSAERVRVDAQRALHAGGVESAEEVGVLLDAAFARFPHPSAVTATCETCGREQQSCVAGVAHVCFECFEAARRQTWRQTAFGPPPGEGEWIRFISDLRSPGVHTDLLPRWRSLTERDDPSPEAVELMAAVFGALLDSWTSAAHVDATRVATFPRALVLPNAMGVAPEIERFLNGHWVSPASRSRLISTIQLLLAEVDEGCRFLASRRAPHREFTKELERLRPFVAG